MFTFVVLTLAVSAMAKDLAMEKFQQYIADHGKVYAHDEFRGRFANFKDNLAFVESHDAAAAGFTVALNKFADMSAEEFSAVYKGYTNQKSVKGAGYAGTFEYDPSFTGGNSTVDWRTKGAVTGVKNQGQCGSCWSFSATGSMEGQHFLSGQGSLVGLSEQNLVDCSTAQGNMGCNGGLMDDAFQYVISNNGIDSESSYPYTATGPNTCQFNAANVATTITGYQDIPSGNDGALWQAVQTVGPISVAIDASQSSFQFYSGGVYSDPACSSSQLDHGVLAVGGGVDSSSGKAYYLVKNSWGTDWGLNGYIMMLRGSSNMCGIATAASYPTISSQ